MFDTLEMTLAALTRAWLATAIGSSLLFLAAALSRVDPALYFSTLQDALEVLV